METKRKTVVGTVASKKMEKTAGRDPKEEKARRFSKRENVNFA